MRFILVLVLALGAIVSYFWLDQSLAIYFSASNLELLHQVSRKLTDLGEADILFGILFLVYLLTRWSPRKDHFAHWALVSSLSLVFSGLMNQILKFIVGRQRPHLSPTFANDLFDHFNLHWHWQSFPSGHSEAIFAFVTCLAALKLGRGPNLIFFLIATGIASTRVILQQHFLSDVLIGALIGLLGTWTVQGWLEQKPQEIRNFIRRYKVGLTAGLFILVYLSVIAVNDGFMATDEYFTGIVRYIPAQTSHLAEMMRPDDVKSPSQILPLFAAAKMAWAAGVTNPYEQYRGVIFIVGIINMALLLWAIFRFSRWMGSRPKDQILTLLMFSFYFAAPFVFTRPMFEALAAPWLALAAVTALEYDKKGNLSSLLQGVFFISVAFLLRPQVGLCALIFVILPILKREWKSLLWVCAVGLVFFVLAGIPDLILRGSFHQSLIAVFFYNYAHGKDYGQQPLSYYPSLIILLTYSPFLIAKYGKEFLRENLKKQRALWIITFLFVFLHSLFSQKWERFLIPLLPVLIFTVQPYFQWLTERFHQYRVRLISLFVLNGFLFCIASFFPPQKNLIDFSIYLNDHPKIRNIYRLDQSPEWITDAFILGPKPEFVDIPVDNLTQVDWNNCSNALIIAKGREQEIPTAMKSLNYLTSFPVNFLEHMAFKMNPKRNPRRVELRLYGCPYFFSAPPSPGASQ